MAAWRRRVSVAMIGVAAALMIMTSNASQAEALFGIPARQQAAPERLTRMPESVYVRREELQDFVSFSFLIPFRHPIFGDLLCCCLIDSGFVVSRTRVRPCRRFRC